MLGIISRKEMTYFFFLLHETRPSPLSVAREPKGRSVNSHIIPLSYRPFSFAHETVVYTFLGDFLLYIAFYNCVMCQYIRSCYILNVLTYDRKHTVLYYYHAHAHVACNMSVYGHLATAKTSLLRPFFFFFF